LAKVFKNSTSTKIITALLSLVLSFTFWLMLTSSETTNQDKAVLLELILPSEDMLVPAEQFPETVSMRVEATAGQLKVIDSRRLVLRVDLTQASEGPGVIDFDPEEMAKALQFPWGARITRAPDPINYVFYGYETKVVPVVMSLIDNYDDRLNVQGPIVISPDVATLRGPTNMMASIRSIPIEVSRGSASPGFSIEVNPNLSSLGSNKIRLFPEVVFTATPNVEWKRENKTFDCPVELASNLSVPAGSSLRISPDTVAVTVSWPANYQNSAENSGVRAEVAPNMTELERIGGMRVNVKDNLPYPDLVMVRINPSRVYVSLRKEQVEEKEEAPRSNSTSTSNNSRASTSSPSPRGASDTDVFQGESSSSDISVRNCKIITCELY
jgi:hypothetical protein